MSEVISKATRLGYAEGLCELGKTHEDMVVLDADLAGATMTCQFKKEFPASFVDCGIAEQNMMSIAAGLAATGKLTFASSFAMFAAGSAFEQVRNSIGYPHLPVKIGATHAGISVGEDGATHQCNEDIALMRTIPGMTIINPADAVEAKAAVIAAAEIDGPVYMRFGRFAVPVFNDEEDYKFEVGKAVVLKEGTDVSIIATGLLVNEARIASEMLEKEGISAEIINVHTIKPLDTDTILASIGKTGCAVVAEEHSIIGGLSSAVCEALCDSKPAPVVRVGINDEFGMSGSAAELLKHYGLSAENLVAKAKEAINRK